MKGSLFAFIRSLVLPWNAGPNDSRIELDGDVGSIKIFNNADLVGQWDSTSFGVFSPSTDPVPPGVLIVPGVLGAPTNIFISGESPAPGVDTVSAALFVDAFGGPGFAPFLTLVSRTIQGRNAAQLLLIGEDDLGNPALFDAQTNGGRFNLSNTALEFDGDITFTRTGVSQLEITGGNVEIADVLDVIGDIRRNGVSMPRGLVGGNSNVNNVALSTTVGTYVDVVEAATLPVIAGREYRVLFYGGDHLASATGPFLVTDSWRFRLSANFAAGGYNPALINSAKHIRSNIAVAGLHRIPNVIGRYSPGASGNVSIKCEASKIVGGAGLTTSANTDGGNSPFRIELEDIGP